MGKKFHLFFPKIVTPQYIVINRWSQMHCAAETLLEIFAFPAHSRAHPRPFAHKLEAVVPHIQQFVLLDISLH